MNAAHDMLVFHWHCSTSAGWVPALIFTWKKKWTPCPSPAFVEAKTPIFLVDRPWISLFAVWRLLLQVGTRTSMSLRLAQKYLDLSWTTGQSNYGSWSCFLSNFVHYLKLLTQEWLVMIVFEYTWNEHHLKLIEDASTDASQLMSLSWQVFLHRTVNI